MKNLHNSLTIRYKSLMHRYNVCDLMYESMPIKWQLSDKGKKFASRKLKVLLHACQHSTLLFNMHFFKEETEV